MVHLNNTCEITIVKRTPELTVYLNICMRLLAFNIRDTIHYYWYNTIF